MKKNLMKKHIVIEQNYSNKKELMKEYIKYLSDTTKIITLNPNWVTGIIDAEGNFSITQKYPGKGSVEAKKKLNIQPTPGFNFKVTQNIHSCEILLYLKEYFKCGAVSIDNVNTHGYKFLVSDTKDVLTKVIPHLEKCPLMTSKYLDYKDFKDSLIEYKDDSERNDLDYIWLRKDQMNSKRSFEERWRYLNSIDNRVLKSEWVQAFIDGEGSFQFYIPNKDKSSLQSRLEVSQHSHDVKVLFWIKEFFNGEGFLKPKFDINSLAKSKSALSKSEYRSNKYADIIKFVDAYPMLTNKRLDYLDWKLLIKLKSENAHKTPESLKDMKDIRSGMNSKRYKYN